MISKATGTIRTIGAAALLVGILGGGWRQTPDARAAVASRGDPSFWIGPGATQTSSDDKLQITVSVNSPVQHVSYVIHGPQGTAVHSVQYTGGALSGLESYTFAADQATHRYLVTATVKTSFVALVTITEQLVTLGSMSLQPITFTGLSNQGITTVVGG
jgi:hypothetical protein